MAQGADVQTLVPLAPGLWHVPHTLRSMGIPMATRMTVVRLSNGDLWLHSPVPLSLGLRSQLDALGPVRHIVAPNLSHHLFAGAACAAYPAAQLWGPLGLRRKHPDWTHLQGLPDAALAPWAQDLGQVFVPGIPALDETVWFHHASGTAIITDLAMWFDGDALPWGARLYGHMSGVMRGLALPLLVRLLTRDRQAAAAACRSILAWPIRRVLVAHTCVIERDARAQLARAWAWLRVEGEGRG